jgi:putative transport protein
VLTFALGLAAGVLLGMIPIPLPGETTLRLGIAGGPLLVALVLGAIGRTGPLVWLQPYSAVLTLRQLGLVLFLAAVGTRSGFAFAGAVGAGEGLDVVLVGMGLTFSLSLATLLLAQRSLRLPVALVAGVVTGQQTQPAALAYAVESVGNDVPHVGYTTVFATATVLKIVLAQIVLLLAR